MSVLHIPAPMRVLRIALLATICTMLFAPDVLAQDFEQIGPKQPQANPPANVDAPAQSEEHAPAPANANKRILDRLTGLRIVAHIAAVQKNGADTQGVDVSAVPALNDPGLKAKLNAHIGKPLSFGDLHAITAEIVAFYRARHQPLVDVAVPQQDVTSGTVQIVVTRFALGKVKVAGNHWFASDLLRRGVRATPGAPLDLNGVRRDLDWLNRNPFRKVDAVLEKGEAAGTTNVILKTQDRFPMRVYAGFDNSGTRATGLARWSAGINYGNLFGTDQQISYQFSASDDFVRHLDAGDARFMAHAMSYTAPLPWHDLVQIFGSYARQVPDLGPFFGQIGHSGQASIRYVHPMDGPAWLNHEVQFGFDFKSTDNNLAFGGTQIFASTQETDQFLLTYRATASDPYGATTLRNDLVWSPGGLTGHNNDAAFAASGTAYARAKYLYNTISVTRATRLPYDATWVMRARAQWADGNLLPAEQLGAGGEDSVRGYDMRQANGSQGVLLSQELRSPPFSPSQMFGASIGDTAQVLAFVDYARVSDKHTQPKTPKHVSLASIGLGINYVLGRYLDVHADYGWQLNTAPGATSRSGRANFAITLSY